MMTAFASACRPYVLRTPSPPSPTGVTSSPVFPNLRLPSAAMDHLIRARL